MTTYPDHHEGIVGRQLDPDGLLSLDESAMPLREALVAVHWHLLSATMVGNKAPSVSEMSKRMRDVQPGDLVVEWMMGSSRRADRDTRIKALGYLIEHRMEWGSSEADWAAYKIEEPEGATEDNRATDHAWYIQYGPDPKDICRWSNCEFRMVPIDRAQWSW